MATDDEYDVEEILDHKKFEELHKAVVSGGGLRHNFCPASRDKKTHCQWVFLVKWEGYEEKDATWEPESNLSTYPGLIDYKKRNNLPMKCQRFRGSFKWERRRAKQIKSFETVEEVEISPHLIPATDNSAIIFDSESTTMDSDKHNPFNSSDNNDQWIAESIDIETVEEEDSDVDYQCEEEIELSNESAAELINGNQDPEMPVLENSVHQPIKRHHWEWNDSQNQKRRKNMDNVLNTSEIDNLYEINQGENLSCDDDEILYSLPFNNKSRRFIYTAPVGTSNIQEPGTESNTESCDMLTCDDSQIAEETIVIDKNTDPLFAFEKGYEDGVCAGQLLVLAECIHQDNNGIYLDEKKLMNLAAQMDIVKM